jgi:hypothetical protein
VRLVADGGAEGLEIDPNLLILTIAIAFKEIHCHAPRDAVLLLRIEGSNACNGG